MSQKSAFLKNNKKKLDFAPKWGYNIFEGDYRLERKEVKHESKTSKTS